MHPYLAYPYLAPSNSLVHSILLETRTELGMRGLRTAHVAAAWQSDKLRTYEHTSPSHIIFWGSKKTASCMFFANGSMCVEKTLKPKTENRMDACTIGAREAHGGRPGPERDERAPVPL